MAAARSPNRRHISSPCTRVCDVTDVLACLLNACHRIADCTLLCYCYSMCHLLTGPYAKEQNNKLFSMLSWQYLYKQFRWLNYPVVVFVICRTGYNWIRRQKWAVKPTDLINAILFANLQICFLLKSVIHTKVSNSNHSWENILQDTRISLLIESEFDDFVFCCAINSVLISEKAIWYNNRDKIIDGGVIYTC